MTRYVVKSSDGKTLFAYSEAPYSVGCTVKVVYNTRWDGQQVFIGTVTCAVDGIESKGGKIRDIYGNLFIKPGTVSVEEIA